MHDISGRPTITEADAERMIDRVVMRALEHDTAYRNAADAEEQATREADIEQMASAKVYRDYVVA